MDGNLAVQKPQAIIISGLSRCGSSLTMQMLHAGGMPISCAPGNEAVSGEHDDQLEALKLLATGGANGKAIKCLDPHRFPLPPGNYITIWCCRNFNEQAKSITKFMLGLGIPTNRRTRKEIEKSLPTETNECITRLRKFGPVYKYLFEDTIIDPLIAAKGLAEILRDFITLDVDKMAAVVIQRDTKCYDGFMELQIIERAKP